VPSLSFLGAAETVTGSKYLVEAGDRRVLVDCGLFQGLRELRRRNWDPLPVDPASIDVVVLTHAHLDHTGYLPRLVAQGFKGHIFSTPGTADLCKLVLPDAGRLQEEDARQANKHGYTRWSPAEPLFTEADAFEALSRFKPVGFDRPVPVTSGVEVEFVPAGHLLGSAFVRMRFGNSAASGAPDVLFGGDLGRYERPVLPDPTPVTHAGVLLVESTYGDRDHEPDDDGEQLAQIVRETVKAGGKVIVPAFAIGRVEEILYWLKKLEDETRIPSVPVFVDSPMAVDGLKFYGERSAELDPDMRNHGRKALQAFATRRFQTVNSTQQSKELTASKLPAIVISSSGMATGGRVLHHLKSALPDARHTVLFVGYQAEGTRGRDLVDGAKEVKIHGQFVPVNARIQKIDSMSAHADRGETLRWLRHFEQAPKTTYLVHGEPGAQAALKADIERELGWKVEVAKYREMVEI
jgi:metallo-beta-lactamase family protein